MKPLLLVLYTSNTSIRTKVVRIWSMENSSQCWPKYDVHGVALRLARCSLWKAPGELRPKDELTGNKQMKSWNHYWLNIDITSVPLFPIWVSCPCGMGMLMVFLKTIIFETVIILAWPSQSARPNVTKPWYKDIRYWEGFKCLKWPVFQGNFKKHKVIYEQVNSLGICKIAAILSWPQYVDSFALRQNGQFFADDIFKCIFFK